MDTAIILKSIARHISLTPAEEAYFTGMLEFKSLKLKKWLLREGEVCKHSIFVTRGCLRSFSVDKNGFEHVLTFAPKGWWIADMYSLLSHKPGTLNIETLQDSEVLL